MYSCVMVYRWQLLPRVANAFVFFLLTVVLLGCPRPQEPDVKGDLTKYMEEARSWAETEAKINTAIISVRREQFVNDEFTITTLKPIVGITQQYVQKLETYHPHEKPLQNVHQEYIEAWRAHQFALAAIIACVEKKDYVQLAKANSDLQEAQRSVSDALSNLATLLQRAGLRSPNAPVPGQASPMSPQQAPGFAPHSQGQ